MLSVRDLCKTYKSSDTPAVDHLNFEFERGKIIGLLGPNGAGKTTTISILSGLIEQYSGEVTILGHNRKGNAERLKNLISVVPQQIALYPTLSCKENLLYYGRMYNIPDSKLNPLINDFLHEFGLYDHADKQIKNYSGGMKRRANIIASLLNEPELLILDEPTAGVDVQSRIMILNFLKQYHSRGKSIIYTSHLLEEAESLCEEILIIDKGKKVIQGVPQDLIKTHDAVNLENLFLKLTGSKVRD
jgi:ABC-2 type transport system ATP-binding protein